MMYELKALPLSPANDPWESIDRRIQFGKNILTSVEFTVTNLCNLRCEHCAVGDVLTHKESDDRVPIEILIQRLEEIPYLDTLSITGGEPMYNKRPQSRCNGPNLLVANTYYKEVEFRNGKGISLS